MSSIQGFHPDLPAALPMDLTSFLQDPLLKYPQQWCFLSWDCADSRNTQGSTLKLGVSRTCWLTAWQDFIRDLRRTPSTGPPARPSEEGISHSPPPEGHQTAHSAKGHSASTVRASVIPSIEMPLAPGAPGTEENLPQRFLAVLGTQTSINARIELPSWTAFYSYLKWTNVISIKNLNSDFHFSTLSPKNGTDHLLECGQ